MPWRRWTGSIIGSKLDDAVEKMAQVGLTFLCESHLATTAKMAIVLFPICDREDLVWQQRLEALSNLKGPHFSAGWAPMGKYVSYLFNLQHNTGRTIIE
jgi:hypothetical protein